MDNIERLGANLTKIESASKEIRGFIDKIVDVKSFVETDVFLSSQSFLDGSDALGEGVVTGYATIDNTPVYLFAQNFEVLKGSLSSGQAAKIQKVMDMAVKTGVPFVSIINSAGARVGEGVSVLEGYAKIIKSASMMSGVVPHIAIIKGACVGLMSAYAALADFVFVSEKDAYVSVNSPMAVAADAKKAPKSTDILGSSYLGANGFATITYGEKDNLKAKISELFSVVHYSECADDPNRLSVKLNKDKSLASVLEALCDGGKYVELNAANTDCIFTALAKVNGFSVGILATKDNEICQGGLKKATNFVNTLDKLGLPMITLVNASGIKSNLEKEQKGINVSLAQLLSNVALSNINKIAVITGNAVGAIYTAFASKAIGYDYVVAFPDACVAPLSAETAVNFLYKDEISKAKDAIKAREKLYATYTEREGNPFISSKDGFIDNIIEPKTLRPYIASILNMLD